MRLNKITVALAAAAAAGASGSVHAANFLSGTPGNFAKFNDDGVASYASEIDATGGVQLQENTGSEQDLASRLGFGVSAGATRFVRYDFNDASLPTGMAATTITANDLIVRTTMSTQTTNTTMNTGNGVVTASQLSVVEGGNPGDSFVIFEFTANDGAGDISLSQGAEVVLKTPSGLQVTSTNSATAQYRLFETGTAASNEGTELASATGQFLDFASAVTVNVGNADEDRIDVATNSTNFDDNPTDTVSAIGELNATLTNGPPLWSDGKKTTKADVIGNGATLEVEADFSAVPEASGSPDPSQVTLSGKGADTLTNTKATFTVDGSGPLPKLFGDGKDDTTTGAKGVIAMNVKGDEPIPESPEITATYNPAAPASATTSIGSLGKIGELLKNGSTASTNLNLDPNGVFRNFVRITNRSGIGGSVFITVFNDAGDSVGINLSDIAGQSDNQLGAQASTTVIPIGDILDAAQSVDSSFGLASSDRNKLRITVEGEFPAIAVDNVTVANDNSTFSKFN